MKIKPESEISCHITLTSVISGLFHTRYLYHCSLGLLTHRVKLVEGATPGDILAAALTLSRYTPEEGSW